MNTARLIQITPRKKLAEDEFWTMMSALYEQQLSKFLPPQLPIEDLPSRTAKNFVTTPDAPVPDCVTCGACCMFLFVIGLNSADNVPAENVWDIAQKGANENQEIIVDRFLRRNEKLFTARRSTP